MDFIVKITGKMLMLITLDFVVCNMSPWLITWLYLDYILDYILDYGDAEHTINTGNFKGKGTHKIQGGYP